MKANLAQELPIPQGEVVRFPKKERQAMSNDKFDKGYVASSRLYRYEVRPFLSDSAKNVYAELEDRINGFKGKVTDHVSYSQLQGGKLKGAKKTSQMTIRKGLKELLDLGVITLVSENSRKGNEYQINEVSLVEHFKKCSTTTKSVVLQNMESTTTKSVVLGTTKSVDTIELIYITSIELLNKTLRLKQPLEVNFYCFQEFLKTNQDAHVSAYLKNLQDLKTSTEAQAEKERKEKARKLSFKEVIKLTSENFKPLCDFNLWEQYVENRSQISKTRLTKNALNLIYKDLKAWGYDNSNKALESSISNNYQGLFAPKQQNFIQTSQASTRWSEIQELIIREEQGNDSYGF